jgi:hypothetical protein
LAYFQDICDASYLHAVRLLFSTLMSVNLAALAARHYEAEWDCFLISQVEAGVEGFISYTIPFEQIFSSLLLDS